MGADLVYRFRYRDGEQDAVRIPVSEQDGSIQISCDGLPDWARLDHHQCSHCPLAARDHEWCPLAANLAVLVGGISPRQSHEPVDLMVETAQRNYQLTTTMQRAMGSLFGLISSLSGCPHTLALRPMGRFHLPVATERETLVRTVSFFLLEQFLDQRGESCKRIDLADLTDLYKNLNTLNRCFALRLREAARTDTTINALMHLDCLVREVSVELNDQLNILEHLFHDHLPGQPSMKAQRNSH